MNKTDFRNGLLLGACCGFGAALILGVLLFAGGNGEEAVPRDVEELRQRLQQAEEARRQSAEDVAEFQQLAELMKTRFQELERRFEELSTQCERAVESSTPAARGSGSPP